MMTLYEKLKAVTGKVKFADMDKVIARQKTCNKCEHLMTFYRCKQCNCFMDFKTRIDKAKCPIGKW